ncbi:MAG: Gfo/Idh/MocA family oxidoreductase [Planctomycetes bacterium]|nr:Gfo/Idh/MocA family oxidoreductase [Planctomycetota bacterium]
MENKKISRRSFTKGILAAGSVFSIVPRHVLGGPGYTAPSDELTKAVIGVGGMGQGHLRYKGAKLVAICDVDKNHLSNTLKKVGPEVKAYTDYREILARPDIDIVHLPVPPHWHGQMAIAAAEAGKDIWCEKPMTRTIGEGIKLVEAVQRNSTIFRLNTWFRFTGNFYGMNTTVAPIKKLVESGLLGWPLKATVSGVTGFNWKFNWCGKVNLTPQPVPAELDYDMWLGPAPFKPYHKHRTHRTFRGYWDYDGGGLGDMGQHYLDPVQYLMGKDDTSPVYIEADSPVQHPDAVDVKPWRRIYMRYADGCELILDGANADKSAAFLEGPNGKVFKGFKSDIPNLMEKLAEFPDPAPQVTDFSEAVRTRQKFALNESNGFRSSTIINLGKIAIRTRRPLHFDPVKLEFKNDDQANRLINQPSRAKWSV